MVGGLLQLGVLRCRVDAGGANNVGKFLFKNERGTYFYRVVAVQPYLQCSFR